MNSSYIQIIPYTEKISSVKWKETFRGSSDLNVDIFAGILYFLYREKLFSGQVKIGKICNFCQGTKKIIPYLT